MRILVVDDNRSSADALSRALSKRGDHAEAVYNGLDAIERLGIEPPDLVLTDLKMEPIDGMAVLEAARAQRPPVEVIVFTAYGGVEVAVEAMRLGVRDFLTKPVTLEQLTSRIDAMRPESEQRPTGPSHAPPDEGDEVPFFDHSPASKALADRLQRAATAPSHVWLEGEIGSGRGHSAYTLHRLSGGEGELRTMEVSRVLDWPTRGTIVLSNVDDLPDDLQRDLARQLARVPRGVRVIATSRPDSERRVVEGQIRPELYYKLAVITVTVPPLRERREDVLPILDDALQRFAKRYDRAVPELTADQRSRLQAHAWPGNVRELLNVAERAVVLGPEAVDGHPLRPAQTDLPTFSPGFNLLNYLDDHEREVLKQAWQITDGDIRHMARILGIQMPTLKYKLKARGVTNP